MLILSELKNLNKDEHYEIFKIINKNNIKYTENSNGIFIDYNIIPEKVLKEIENFITFSKKNKKMLDKKEKNEQKYIINMAKENTYTKKDIIKKKEVILSEKNIHRILKIKKENKRFSGVRDKIIKKIKEKKNQNIN